VTLSISTEEFDVIADACHHHVERLRMLTLAICLQGDGIAMSGALSIINRVIMALESTASRCRALGARYSAGESEVSRVITQVGHGLIPVAAALNRLVYLEAVLAAVLAARTAPGAQLVAMLAPGRLVLSQITSAGTAVGVLASGEVDVVEHPGGRCDAPRGFAQLVERIPEGESQVRIDTITESGQRRFIVYIAGTRDFGLHPSSEPWDMTSNMQALSQGAASDSERAVRAAMTQAGIDASSPVVLVGHSQGGLIASRLAASGDFAVTDFIVAGAPSHQVAIPERIRVTAFEHVDDVVPALSGPALAATAATVFVRGPAPTQPAPSALPAHDLKAYVQTAQALDRSVDPLARARQAAADPGQNARCSTNSYTAWRQLEVTTSSRRQGER
jgi:pimeloyl-ACP methyl ester carboxylesterase